MSTGLNTALTTARSSLNALQSALNVTSNNISNASTTGYHRQTVSLNDNVEILSDGSYYGTGVSVATVTRTYSSALEASLSAANTADGYNQAYLDYVSQAEDLVAPSGDSAAVDAMSNFMSAVQDVETNPEDDTYRESLISAAKTLASALNSSYSSLDTINTGVATTDGSTNTDPVTGETHEIVTSGTAADAVTEVNSYLGQIADLNDQIASLELASGGEASDLRDSRDELVQKLSSYMSVDVSEDKYGRYTVTTANGDSSGDPIVLVGVTGTGTSNYSSYSATVNAEFTPASSGSNYDTIDFSVYSNGQRLVLDGSGELGAYSDSYDYINEKMQQIYNLDYQAGSTPETYMGYAQAISSTVNSVLDEGYTLEGTHPTEELFKDTYASSGSILTVNTSYTASDVAACYYNSTGSFAQGDGTNMERLYTAFNTAKTTLYSNTDSSGSEVATTSTLAGYANTYVNAIANDVETATSSAKTSAATVTMYTNAISSKSGVNSDTELTNMIAIQQAYAASAKVVSTIQSMYESLMSLA